MTTLTVNGRRRRFSGDPETPLLWVLREQLGLTGTRYGCGAALCGACTVLVDGAPVRACVTPVGTIGTARVTTIEGLGGNHPVQQAWDTLQVAQCGYCQSGQIMAAVALLAQTPQPGDAEIDAAMDGQLCRCATYARIRAAIRVASGQPAGLGETSIVEA